MGRGFGGRKTWIWTDWLEAVEAEGESESRPGMERKGQTIFWGVFSGHEADGESQVVSGSESKEGVN